MDNPVPMDVSEQFMEQHSHIGLGIKSNSHPTMKLPTVFHRLSINSKYRNQDIHNALYIQAEAC